MTERLRLHVTFESDWHVGEGAGSRGYIDAIVRRHPEGGLPYLPAKTLTGILRDGCERIVYGLDSARSDGPWHALLRAIFGADSEDPDPRARDAALSVMPARFDADLRRALCERPEIAEALVFLKPGIQLDEEGVAKTDMLRFEEVVLAGAQLSADLELALDGERRRSALALIAAGAKVVERLGAGRRRGSGRCRLTLAGGPEQTQLPALLRAAPPESGPEGTSEPSLILSAPESNDSGDWNRLAIELDLETPVLVPAETLGNVVTTRDHIPGSLLLPALDRWLRALLGGRTTSALAAGAIQVRNAYPAIDRQRLLPVPAALFKLKDGDVYTNHLPNDPEGKAQRKQQRLGYVGAAGLPWLGADGSATPGVLTVDTLTVTHAAIEDGPQRPTSRVGGVFTYQALHPRQRHFECFIAELWISTSLVPELPNGWVEACPAHIRIGRAKKDDYGRVRVSCRVETAPSGTRAAHRLTLWLTSPLLLRDSALRPVLSVQGVLDGLTQALNAGVTQSDHIRLSVPAPESARNPSFVRPWRDDGWINAWQMQRPTRFGLAAGSCVLIEADREIPAGRLARVQARGLGERRAEGYGEILIDAEILGEPTVPALGAKARGTPAKKASVPGLVPLEPSGFTRALQRRAARLAVERRVLQRDRALRRKIGWESGDRPQPPNTQLGALRALMETLRDPSGLQRVAGWIDAIEGNDDRRAKWPQRTLQKLRTHIADVEAIWCDLGLPDGPQALAGHDREALARELRCEAIRALWLVAVSRQLNENNRRVCKDSARET